MAFPRTFPERRNKWPSTFEDRVEVASRAIRFGSFVRDGGDDMVKATKRHTPIDEPRLTGYREIRTRGGVRAVHTHQALPHPPGTLRESIERVPYRTALLGDERVHVSGAQSDLDWASFIEDGAAPHPIPRAGEELDHPMVFFWEREGMWLATYHVNHPGVRHPSHMFLKGAEEVAAGVEERGERFMGDWAKEYFS